MAEKREIGDVLQPPAYVLTSMPSGTEIAGLREDVVVMLQIKIPAENHTMATEDEDRTSLMSDENKKTLTDKRVDIVDNFPPMKDVMTYLLQEKIINKRNQQQIESHGEGLKQVEVFLDILAAKSNWTYNALVGVLDTNGYSHVAKIFKRPETDLR